MAYDIVGALRAAGHRVTRPRLEVWRALRLAGGHMTVEELTERVRHSVPDINLASVYRALSLFERLELARQSRLSDSDARHWEVAHPDEHFHLVCDSCGSVEHHGGQMVRDIRHHLDEHHGFSGRTVDLTVRGQCHQCQNAPGDPAERG